MYNFVSFGLFMLYSVVFCCVMLLYYFMVFYLVFCDVVLYVTFNFVVLVVSFVMFCYIMPYCLT